MSYFLCPHLPRNCAKSLFSSFHSTANHESQRLVKSTSQTVKRTSRTRLEKNLKPTTRERSAESRPKFERDALPHFGRPPQEDFGSQKRTPRPLPPSSSSSSTPKVKNDGLAGSWDWDVDLHRKSKSRSVKDDRRARRLTTSREDDTMQDVPASFSSPPLLPGLLTCLKDIIGPNSNPTPIQSLSLKWLLENSEIRPETETPSASSWKQVLLASETGSGKSIAYLLPVIQALKQSEPLGRANQQEDALPLNPRAIVLAPTHELSRQLTSFSKSLIHEVKLRILCASRANTRSSRHVDESVSEVKGSNGTSELVIQERKSSWPVDMVIGTPNKLMDMIKGRGWDKEEVEDNDESRDPPLPSRRDRFGPGKPEMGLANVEWVVIDEADVLMDPDFQEITLKLLSDIAAARGYTVPPNSPDANVIVPHDYPFNLILTSATIPSALATYLDTHHPKLRRLVSPGVHQLPKTLQTEFASWTGGNKNADIEHRIRRVWAEDTQNRKELSKVLIFCNQNTKVDALSEYLTSKSIKNVALTSQGSERKKGSNHHLDGFLRVPTNRKDDNASPSSPSPSDPSQTPHVMITTSLLSRGLDFSPEMRHIFIVDEPRNMIDFLHRAGRSGRAGQRGKVVVFGKMKGRGSSKAKDVRQRVKALV
ncbi:hypothetical protein ONZ45_g12020 [Pleurotus djamor]|nr:hypothetical protein ONZ45_g12020 [Pleurotus djamor]